MSTPYVLRNCLRRTLRSGYQTVAEMDVLDLVPRLTLLTLLFSPMDTPFDLCRIEPRVTLEILRVSKPTVGLACRLRLNRQGSRVDGQLAKEEVVHMADVIQLRHK
jgi:hypothetical protein